MCRAWAHFPLMSPPHPMSITEHVRSTACQNQLSEAATGHQQNRCASPQTQRTTVRARPWYTTHRASRSLPTTPWQRTCPPFRTSEIECPATRTRPQSAHSTSCRYSPRRSASNTLCYRAYESPRSGMRVCRCAESRVLDVKTKKKHMQLV